MSNILSIDVGIKNFAVCLMNKEEIIFWEIFELQKNCKKLLWDRIMLNLKNKLQHIIDLYKVDQVLIERQMNARMRMVSVGALMFFMSNNIPAEIVSATEKLKHTGKNKSYAERKKLAICLTRFYLLQERYHPWIQYFNSHKKKDDLSDSFLYSFNHLLTRNP